MFPTISYLDDFNRANEGPPLSTRWTSLVGGLKVVSNQAAGNLTTNNTEAYNNKAFGPDVDVFVTIAVAPLDTEDVGLFYRLTAGFNGYWLQIVKIAAATDAFRLYRLDGGVGTQLGADMLQEIVAGDRFGVRAIGGLHRVYYNPVNTQEWRLLGSRTENTYYGKEAFALRIVGTTGRLDMFSGCTIGCTEKTPMGSRYRPAIFKPGLTR